MPRRLYDRRDYSIFYLYGVPRAGQTLDQLSGLLIGELDRIRKGEFEEWLLKAVIDNYRKSLVQSRENPENASWTYLDSFIKGIPYIDSLKYIESLADISKKDIMKFAGSLKYYARINKLAGKPENRVKVEKPAITPVAVNADKISDYGKRFAALPPSPLPELDTVDFRKDFTNPERRLLEAFLQQQALSGERYAVFREYHCGIRTRSQSPASTGRQDTWDFSGRINTPLRSSGTSFTSWRWIFPFPAPTTRRRFI